MISSSDWLSAAGTHRRESQKPWSRSPGPLVDRLPRPATRGWWLLLSCFLPLLIERVHHGTIVQSITSCACRHCCGCARPHPVSTSSSANISFPLMCRGNHPWKTPPRSQRTRRPASIPHHTSLVRRRVGCGDGNLRGEVAWFVPRPLLGRCRQAERYLQLRAQVGFAAQLYAVSPAPSPSRLQTCASTETPDGSRRTC